MTIFKEAHYRDDEAARIYLENLLWADGPVCPHCGVVDHAYKTKRLGVYRCASKECRKDFSVTVGTVMERSKIALHKWLIAFHLMTASKKGISAHQLHRMLDIGYEAAWFMCHRIREAMRDGGLKPPMGGNGSIVEADETYFGKTEEDRVSPSRKGRPYKYAKKGPRDKRPIVSLVERGGRVRSFHVAVATKVNVTEIVRSNIARETRLHTDESNLYKGSDEHFASHETVRHTAKEYARGDVHTNTVEGVFSIFKRGMKGVYQHCKEKHLHRYLAEFDFRYNNRTALGVSDGERAALAIMGIVGKRLTYHQPDEA